MSIAILSAKTGNGHVSVMNALVEEFKRQDYNDLILFPDFYEELIYSNRILSDFYNFLLANSIDLCEKYVEFTAITRPDKHEEIYRECSGKITELLKIDGLTTVVSTAPLINYNIIRSIKDNNLTSTVKFYIVVTDPYKPISPGFDVKGVSGYFCATDVVRDLLQGVGIDSRLIKVSGFPISERFCVKCSCSEKKIICKSLGIEHDVPTIIINSGALGAPHYLKFLKMIVEEYDYNVQVVFICGKNKVLFNTASNYIKMRNKHCIKILPFITNIDEVLIIADIAITKAGANTFYECLNAGVPIIIDGTCGFPYQERGAIDFLEQYQVGEVLYKYNELPNILTKMLDLKFKQQYRSNIQKLNLKNGAYEIVKHILTQIQKQ